MGRHKKKRLRKTTKTATKPIRQNQDTFMYGLMKDLSLSLKRHKKFGSYIYSFFSLERYVKNEHEWEEVMWNYRRRFYSIIIGNDVIMPTFPTSNVYGYSASSYCNSLKNEGLLGKILILFYLLKRKNESNFLHQHVLEAFVVDEVAKIKDRKIYPNELVFIFLFGTIGASISLVVISFLLCLLFSTTVGLTFTCFVILMLLLGRLLVFFNEKNLVE